MDCHVFRRVCEALTSCLLGARVEKIHRPAPEVTMFTLYASGQKRFLFVRASRKTPFLFLSTHKIPVGTTPPADIMRLRKYLSGQRLVEARILWLERRLLLRTPAGVADNGEPVWLDVDLREGPRLMFENPFLTTPEEAFALAEDADTDALWPNINTTPPAWTGEAWRQWPVLSPALRRTLPLLEDDFERAALLSDLRAGGGDIFVYGVSADEEDAAPTAPERVEVSAWPLPEALRQGRDEQVFTSPLEAVEQAGDIVVLRELTHKAGKAAAKPLHDEAVRIGRLLTKLERERERLHSMAEGKILALQIQAELYRFQPNEKYAQIMLLVCPETPVTLNPRLTVRENMASLFHQAARGARGLAMTEARVATLQQERDTLLMRAAREAENATLSGATVPQQRASGKPGTKTTADTSGLPKNIQAFRSTDGFMLLRGRDAKGNAAALKRAAPQDLWLHTAGVTGAHVIIRRDHAMQIVPQRTLEQAGILAALKSERRDETHANIWCAQVRYIRPLRSARGAGNVRIDKMEKTFDVTLDASLEDTLRLAYSINI